MCVCNRENDGDRLFMRLFKIFIQDLSGAGLCCVLCFEYAWRMPRVNVLLIFSLNVLVTWLMNKKLMPLTFRVKSAGSLANYLAFLLSEFHYHYKDFAVSLLVLFRIMKRV